MEDIITLSEIIKATGKTSNSIRSMLIRNAVPKAGYVVGSSNRRELAYNVSDVQFIFHKLKVKKVEIVKGRSLSSTERYPRSEHPFATSMCIEFVKRSHCPCVKQKR